MRRLLVITHDVDTGTLPSLPGFSLEECRLSAGIDHLNRGHFDAVLMLIGPEMPLKPLLRQLQGRVSDLRIPIFGAHHSASPHTATLLHEQLIQGMVDLRWGGELIAFSLEALVHLAQRLGRPPDGDSKGINSYHDLIFKDDLTQLNNRRFFDRTIIKEHHRCERFKRPYAIVFADLDNLKEVNLHHGHVVGGQVLQEVATKIAALTRKCDFAFRFGGDEFVILLVDTNKQGAQSYAKRLCAGIRELQINIGGAEIRLTASIGVSAYPEDSSASSEILGNADRAMFQAKNNGKNRVVLFDTKR